MPPITALLHATNAALNLGRALETLLPCTEILIVDHVSSGATRRVAREYGARFVRALPSAAAEQYLHHTSHDWILCIDPAESLTEGLQASLFQWTLLPAASVAGKPSFSLFVREQVSENWRTCPSPETRLVPRNWTQWNDLLPANSPSSIPLEGELLRLAFP
jgi:hypothetical protein